jgi:hypothetical protein
MLKTAKRKHKNEKTLPAIFYLPAKVSQVN